MLSLGYRHARRSRWILHPFTLGHCDGHLDFQHYQDQPNPTTVESPSTPEETKMFLIVLAILVLCLVVRSIPEGSMHGLTFSMITLVSVVIFGFLLIDLISDEGKPKPTEGAKPTRPKLVSVKREARPNSITKMVIWTRDATYYWWICFKNTRRNREHSLSCSQTEREQEDKRPIFSRHRSKLKL